MRQGADTLLPIAIGRRLANGCVMLRHLCVQTRRTLLTGQVLAFEPRHAAAEAAAAAVVVAVKWWYWGPNGS